MTLLVNKLFEAKEKQLKTRKINNNKLAQKIIY